jgi:hypothetical protein
MFTQDDKSMCRDKPTVCQFYKPERKIPKKRIAPSSWNNSVTLYLQDKKYSPTMNFT